MPPPPPHTPRLAALASRVDDTLYGNAELLETLQTTLDKKKQTLQSWDQIPLIYRPAVLSRFGFERSAVTEHNIGMCGWPEFWLTSKGVERGRKGAGVVSGVQFVSSRRCTNPSDARHPTCFSSPSFISNKLRSCSWCRAKGLDCNAENRRFLTDGTIEGEDADLLSECVEYERWLEEASLTQPTKRAAEKLEFTSTGPPSPQINGAPASAATPAAGRGLSLVIPSSLGLINWPPTPERTPASISMSITNDELRDSSELERNGDYVPFPESLSSSPTASTSPPNPTPSPDSSSHYPSPGAEVAALRAQVRISKQEKEEQRVRHLVEVEVSQSGAALEEGSAIDSSATELRLRAQLEASKSNKEQFAAQLAILRKSLEKQEKVPASALSTKQVDRPPGVQSLRKAEEHHGTKAVQSKTVDEVSSEAQKTTADSKKAKKKKKTAVQGDATGGENSLGMLPSLEDGPSGRPKPKKLKASPKLPAEQRSTGKSDEPTPSVVSFSEPRKLQSAKAKARLRLNITELEQQIEQKDASEKKYLATISVLKAQVSRLTQQRDSLRSEKESHQTQQRELELRNNELVRDNQRRQAASEEVACLKAENDRLTSLLASVRKSGDAAVRRLQAECDALAKQGAAPAESLSTGAREHQRLRNQNRKLHAEHQELEKTNSTLRTENAGLRSQLTSAKLSQETAKESHDDTARTLEWRTLECRNLEGQLFFLGEERDQLTAQVSNLQYADSSGKAERNSLLQMNNQLGSELGKLQDELYASQRSISTSSGAAASLRVEINKLKRTIAGLQDDKATLAAKVFDLEGNTQGQYFREQATYLGAEVASLQEERNKLVLAVAVQKQSRSDAAEASRLELSSVTASMITTTSRLESVTQQLETLQAEMGNLQVEKADLASQLTAEKQTNAEGFALLESLETQSNEACRQLESRSTELDQKRQECQALQGTVTQLGLESEKSKTEISSLRSENKNLHTTLLELCSTRDSLQSDIGRLEADTKEYVLAVESKEREISELKASVTAMTLDKEAREHQESEAASSQREKEGLLPQSSQEQATTATQGCNSSCSSCIKTASLANRNAELEQEAKGKDMEREELLTEITFLEETIKELRGRLGQLEEQVATLTKEKDRKVGANKLLGEQISSLHSKCDALGKEKDTVEIDLVAERASRTSFESKIQALEKEKVGLLARVAASGAQVTQTSLQVCDVEAKLDHRGSECAVLRSANAQLHVKVSNLENTIASLNDKLSDLDEYTNQLAEENMNFRYSVDEKNREIAGKNREISELEACL